MHEHVIKGFERYLTQFYYDVDVRNLSESKFYIG